MDCQVIRREGEPAALIASFDKAMSVLDWKPQFDSLERIVADA